MIKKAFLLNKLVECGIIAVVRKVPDEVIEDVADVLVESGITALEITVDSPSAFDVISRLSRKYGSEVVVGAGTVIDAQAAYLAIQSGAEFIFSPSLHEEVIRTSLRYGKIVVPGVMTPTEAIKAVELGADLVKLFPAGALGTKFIKDIKSPFPHISVIPTGGVNLQNASDFIKAGATTLGIGGNLILLNENGEADTESIRNTAQSYLKIVKEARA